VPPFAADGAQLWPSFVTLWLGAESRSLSGFVHGPDGAPFAGAEVWIDDPTFVCGTEGGFATLEGEMRGASDGERHAPVTSAEDGSFVLDGLASRNYRVAAMDPSTLQIVRMEPIAAGSTGVVLDLPADALWERVAGSVVDGHGQPLAGLSVSLERETFRLSTHGSLWRDSAGREAVRTDEAGRFEFARVPREGVQLRVRGETLRPTEVQLESVADPLDIRIETPWLGHVQVALAGVAPAGGRIEIHDEAGHAVDFYVFGGGSVWTRGGIDLANADEFADGRTPVLSVPDSARAVVLLDAEKNELRRVPLSVGAETVQVVL